jgi:hypothetical protein
VLRYVTAEFGQKPFNLAGYGVELMIKVCYKKKKVQEERGRGM